MKKIIIFFGLVFFSVVHAADMVTYTNNPTSSYQYNYMYPYMNNQMRTGLNPGNAGPQNSNPINTIVKTKAIQNTQPRRIVSRTSARSTSPQTSMNTKRSIVPRISRSTTNNANPTNPIKQIDSRRIVARATNTRNKNTNNNKTNITTTSTGFVSTVRCLSDYTDCMNGYCMRENTAYNRCYCSSKLAQIDAKYQNKIENLIKQIINIRGTNRWSDNDMNNYWDEKIGTYTGDNSWVNLDNALNIDWSTMESRVRGQNAFATGHEYCVQHLTACAYSASNLRDVYRSEIARDCSAYENGLERIKNTAESIIEMYK